MKTFLITPEMIATPVNATDRPRIMSLDQLPPAHRHVVGELTRLVRPYLHD